MDKLAGWLEGYDQRKSEFLLQGFQDGFRVGFEGEPTSTVSANLKSVEGQEDIIDEYINKEKAAGRIRGPFRHPPFQSFQCSPVGLVEKKIKGEFRVIHHLSFPSGNSVNDKIPPHRTAVQYASIQDAIDLVRSVCPKAFMAKTDVKKAFRILPIHPEDRHLFVFVWRGMFYVDLAVEMGCSSSCQIFEAFSCAIDWIAQTKLGLRTVHILDDFLIASISKQIGEQDLQSFLSMCADIGVPMAPEKTFPPDTIMSFVGYEIDTVQEQVRLPVDKIRKCLTEIQNVLSKARATLKQIQSIAGLLNFACGVILPGRPFLRRLFDLTIGVRAPHFKIRITQGVKEDLRVWARFLEHHNGKCFFLSSRVLTDRDLHLFTDASGTIGFGAVFGDLWFQGRWSRWWLTQNITLLELYPIVVAIETWGDRLENKQVMLHTDNQALVSVLQNHTSKEPLVMVLVRRLVLHCLQRNLVVRARHILGKENIAADALSRFQMVHFRNACPRARQHPTPIPPLPQSLTST